MGGALILRCMGLNCDCGEIDPCGHNTIGPSRNRSELSTNRLCIIFLLGLQLNQVDCIVASVMQQVHGKGLIVW
jgi:hypothetical protein